MGWGRGGVGDTNEVERGRRFLGGGQNGTGVCVGERGQGIQCCALL